MATPISNTQPGSVGTHNLRDVQSYLFAANDFVRFPDLLKAFPDLPPNSLMGALVELERMDVVSFQIRHNAA